MPRRYLDETIIYIIICRNIEFIIKYMVLDILITNFFIVISAIPIVDLTRSG